MVRNSNNKYIDIKKWNQISKTSKSESSYVWFYVVLEKIESQFYSFFLKILLG